MTQDNFSEDKHKDIARFANTLDYQQIASYSKETVSENIQFSIKALVVKFISHVISQHKNETCVFKRYKKRIQLIGSVAFSKGTLILLDLDYSEFRHPLLTESVQ
jgi:hypothetical protein